LQWLTPEPEIMPEVAHKTRDDVIMATGRSDIRTKLIMFLRFLLFFRGALDVRAKEINEEMKIAAVNAISKIARDSKKFDKNHIVPKILG